MNDKITTLFANYKTQREISETKAKLAKLESKKLRAIENDLVEAMLEAQVKQIGTEDECTLHLRRKIGVSVTEDNREATRDWLTEELGDDQPFMEEVISKTAMTELVEKRVKGGAVEEDFPDFLKVNLHPGVAVHGWKQLMQKKQETTER